jgi:hypothetical protein
VIHRRDAGLPDLDYGMFMLVIRNRFQQFKINFPMPWENQ